MTEPTDRKEPEGPPEQGSGEREMTEAELEAVFRKWEARRGEVTGAEMPVDDSPLAPEELLLEHELAQSPTAMVAKARRAAKLRLVLLGVLLAVAALALWVNREDLAYFGLGEADIVELGDLRARWIAGERDFELEHNTWVRFENAIMTEEREAADTYFFFDPMTNIITVTGRALPEKPPGLTRMHGKFAELVNQRWLHPADLGAGFSGQGRLLRASEAPRRYQSVVDAYREFLRLDERRPDAELWIFLDDVAPRDQAIYVGIFVFALFIVLVSLAFFWRAHRRARIMEELL